MSRRISKEEARSMQAARISRNSGRNGGRYPNDHRPGEVDCLCTGCVRKRVRDARKTAERLGAALELMRRIDQISAEVLRPTRTAAVERQDLDKGQDWGA